jgi:hypothetical protein
MYRQVRNDTIKYQYWIILHTPHIMSEECLRMRQKFGRSSVVIVDSDSYMQFFDNNWVEDLAVVQVNAKKKWPSLKL